MRRGTNEAKGVKLTGLKGDKYKDTNLHKR